MSDREPGTVHVAPEFSVDAKCNLCGRALKMESVEGCALVLPCSCWQEVPHCWQCEAKLTDANHANQYEIGGFAVCDRCGDGKDDDTMFLNAGKERIDECQS